MAINEDGVVATGADNGAMWCWDWRSGNAFQQTETVAQPGSLDAEQGAYPWEGGPFFPYSSCLSWHPPWEAGSQA